MEAWSVHHLAQAATPVLGKPAAEHLKAYAQRLKRADLPVVFTLRHLSKIVGVDYSQLRASVERRREAANYHMFAIKKRSGGRRHIHAVAGELFKVQQFVNAEILQNLRPHQASFAFHAEGGIRACASEHCGARWLFQYDLKDFFYSISEADVYKIFAAAGYRPLLAFELARICTTTRLPEHLRSYLWPKRCFNNDDFLSTVRSPLLATFAEFVLSDDEINTTEGRVYDFVDISHRSLSDDDLTVYGELYKYKFYMERHGAMGVLPQGAPSSPMLSNLAARGLDEAFAAFADQHGLIYTRYADDLTLSAGGELPEGMSVGDIHRAVIGVIRKSGFRENPQKTRIAGPGSKKIVLGLLVDGSVPRLSKDTYKRIDRHLHATQKYGLVEVARHEKFDSPVGFYNHLAGLIAFVKDVDTARWEEFHERFLRLQTPMNKKI